MHGNVEGSNGGRGKISRQRSEPAGSPNWAATPTASTPLALSYIPEILEPMATVIYGVFWHRTEKSLRPSSRNSGNQFSRNTSFFGFLSFSENFQFPDSRAAGRRKLKIFTETENFRLISFQEIRRKWSKIFQFFQFFRFFQFIRKFSVSGFSGRRPGRCTGRRSGGQLLLCRFGF